LWHHGPPRDLQSHLSTAGALSPVADGAGVLQMLVDAVSYQSS
jgi:hypothetical protein